MSTSTAESIQQRMREVRCEIGEDVQDFVESARTMTDWRHYVQQYPWVCLAAAVALGYVVVPRRNPVIALDADAVLELSKKKELVLKPEKKQSKTRGLRQGLVSLLGTMAFRGAMSYLRNLPRTGSEAALKADDGHPKKSSV